MAVCLDVFVIIDCNHCCFAIIIAGDVIIGVVITGADMTGVSITIVVPQKMMIIEFGILVLEYLIAAILI